MYYITSIFLRIITFQECLHSFRFIFLLINSVLLIKYVCKETYDTTDIKPTPYHVFVLLSRSSF